MKKLRVECGGGHLGRRWPAHSQVTWIKKESADKHLNGLALAGGWRGEDMRGWSSLERARTPTASREEGREAHPQSRFQKSPGKKGALTCLSEERCQKKKRKGSIQTEAGAIYAHAK